MATDHHARDWRDRISVAPGVCRGQACIAGTRVLVTVVLDNLAAGRTPQEIVAVCPTITVEDVRAAIAHAAELAHELDGSLWLTGPESVRTRRR